MQDRFKFRVFDTEQARYVINVDDYYYFMIDSDGKLVAKKDEMRDFYSGYDDVVPMDVERFVVEQCTGLKDKNGNLIYEGDILNRKDAFVTNQRIIIAWSNKTAMFIGKTSGGCVGWENCLDFIEIIGNIHTTEKE